MSVEPLKNPPSPKKSRKIFFIAPIVLIVVILAIFFYYEQSKYVYTNDATIQGDFVEISPDILARIITLEVDEGYVVKKGDLLVVLDDSILLSEKTKAEAKVESLKATIALDEVNLKKVSDDYERGVKGIKDRIISSQEYDHLQKAHEAAIAQIELDKAELKLAETALGVVEAKLLHTKIWAPRDGVIAKRWALAGDVMQKGQTIFTLYDLDRIWVLANLQETDFDGVHLGSPVHINIDTYSGVKFTGEVYVIKAAAASEFSFIPQDNATGNYTKVAQRIPLKISIRPPEESKDAKFYLFPGMSAEVKIFLEDQKSKHTKAKSVEGRGERGA